MYNEFEKNIIDISKRIDETSYNISKQDYVIYDGIADLNKYLSSEKKILFLLKESYETKGCYKWQVGKIYEPNKIRKYPTLKRIGYIVHGVRNNILYESIIKASNIVLAADIESIAWVNINKIAAKSRSEHNLTKKYLIWKEIIKEQIDVFDPEIVICGNTLQYIKNDFDITAENKINTSNFKYINSAYCKKNTLYIQMVHPAMVLNKENEKILVNDIVSLINKQHRTTAST